MKSYSLRISLYAALVAVCVFFGIDMATSGMERVGGPVSPSVVQSVTIPAKTPASAPPSASREPNPEKAAAEQKSAALSGPVSAMAGNAEASFINRAFLQMGDGLRYLASGTIRFVVSVFSSIIH